MSEEERTLFFLGAGVIAGIAVFLNGFRLLRHKILIENIPTSKIRSIAMGLVEINGEVVPDKVIKSPFTNKDCVYYRYSIEEYRKQGKDSHWVTIKSGEERVPFFLKDETGSVLVDSKGAKLDIPRNLLFEPRSKGIIPNPIMNFNSSNNVAFKTLFGFNRRLRYTEYTIEPKQKLYIMGTADDNPYVDEGTGESNVEDIMIQKGKNKKFYYISTKKEQDVLKSLMWKIIACILGGSIISVVCLFGILMITGLI